MTRRQNKTSPEELEFAAGLFDASSVRDTIGSGIGPRGPVGFSELYQYVVDVDYVPDETLLVALADDPRVRADFDAIVRNAAVAAIPPAAAAADSDDIEERAVDGWRIRLRQVRANPQQVWVIIEFVDKAIDMPHTLFADDLRQQLPESRDGRFQFRLDEESELVRKLKDMNCELFLV